MLWTREQGTYSAMMLRVFVLLSVHRLPTRSQGNRPEGQPMYLPACAPDHEKSVNASLVFIFFDFATSPNCVCSTTSAKNYSVIHAWAQNSANISVSGKQLGPHKMKLTEQANLSNANGEDSSVDNLSVLVVLEGTADLRVECTQQSQEQATITTEGIQLSSSASETAALTTPTNLLPSSGAQSPTGSSSQESPTQGSGSNGLVSDSTENSHNPSSKAAGDGGSDSDVSDDNDHINNISLVVLGLGGGLIVVAVVVIAVSCVFQRRRQGQKVGDRLKEERVPKRDKRDGHTLGSRDSLLDRHNYEEVSEDGMSGSRAQQKPPPADRPNLFHIPTPGHARQASEGCIARGGAAGAGVCQVDVDVEDDYNKLDLHTSAQANDVMPRPSAGKAKAAAAAEVDDDDYMEIGDDIYEAVDDDATPLCPRKNSRIPREEYTDCVSSPTAGDKGVDVVVIINSQKKDAKTDGARQSSSRPTSYVGNKPDLPTTSPRNQGQLSKSADDIPDKTSVPRPAKHKQSNSVDLRKLDYQNVPIPFPRSQQTSSTNTAVPLGPLGSSAADGVEENTAAAANQDQKLNPTNSTAEPAHLSDSGEPKVSLRNQESSETTIPRDSDPDQVVLRPKSRAPKPQLEFPTMLDHLKETNPGLLAFQEAVRSSMEINDEELVMIDNVLYGTLPRDISLPTTEL